MRLDHVGLDDLAKVIQQIDRILGADPGKPPSAYSIAKLLLVLSGDADEPDNRPPARKLIGILKGAEQSDAQVAEPQMILGLAIMAVGTIIDRAFGTTSPGGPVPAAPLALPGLGKVTKTYLKDAINAVSPRPSNPAGK